MSVNLLNGLVSYWPMDEASGDRADVHGTNDLTNVGPGISTTGLLGNAFRKNGDGDTKYLTISDAAQTGLDATSFTYSAWCRFNISITDFLGLVYKSTSGQRSYWCAVDGTGAVIFPHSATGSGGVQIATAAGAVTTTGWYHIVATADDDGVNMNKKIYVNGVLAASGSTTDRPIFNGTAPFEIARISISPTNSRSYIIDEVGFWNRALSDFEVRRLYNGGKPLKYASLSNGPIFQYDTI